MSKASLRVFGTGRRLTMETRAKIRQLELLAASRSHLGQIRKSSSAASWLLRKHVSRNPLLSWSVHGGCPYFLCRATTHFSKGGSLGLSTRRGWGWGWPVAFGLGL